MHGPNVFAGYLGKETPFIEVEGKKFYRSGDRGHLDEEGNLTLIGRLKRFVKVGGEMIGLDALEVQIARLAKEKKWAPDDVHEPFCALISKEVAGERAELILYSTVALERELVNTALREAGFSALFRIGQVMKIDEIPLNGMGKTHYRKLEELFQEKKT